MGRSWAKCGRRTPFLCHHEFMNELIAQIHEASNAGLYYLALLGALVLPDICGALDSEEGNRLRGQINPLPDGAGALLDHPLQDGHGDSEQACCRWAVQQQGFDF